jgi:uncharacterized membrane protein
MDDNNVPPPPPELQAPPEPPPIPPTPPAPPTDLSHEPEIKDYLIKAWELVLAEPVLMIVGYLVIGIILSLSSAFVVGLLLVGPTLVGFYQVIEKLLNGEPAEFEDLFAGFQDFVRTMVAGLLLCAFILAGSAASTVISFLLAYIPCLGLLVAIPVTVAITLAVIAATFFLMPIVALSSEEPIEAMRQSLSFASDELKPVALLSLVFLALTCVGAAVCGVGLLLTGPIAMIVQVLAYNRYYLPRTR